MPNLGKIIDRVKAVILRAVYTEQVRPFVWLYYIPLWLWGLFGTLYAAPPTYVKPIMGQMVYNFWIWLCLLGTTVVMFGMRLEDKAKVNAAECEPVVLGDLVVLRDKLSRTSIRLQTGGHAAMFCVLLASEVSAIASLPWNGGVTFSIFVILPYVIGCLLLTVQGVAKIVMAEKGGVS